MGDCAIGGHGCTFYMTCKTGVLFQVIVVIYAH